MTLAQAIILAIIVGIAYLGRRVLGDPQLERPIILAPIVGIVLGDVTTGIMVGGALELIFIGAAVLGAAVPPNVAIGTVVGTAFAITTGQGIEVALLSAIPAAVIGAFFEIFSYAACSFLVHRVDAASKDANSRRMVGWIWVGNAIHFSAYAIPTFFALYFGADAVKSVTDALSGRPTDAMSAAAAILPAVGFGILLSILYSKKLFPLFFLGFLVAAFTGITVIGIAGIAITIAIAIYTFTSRRGGGDASTSEARKPIEIEENA